ncbi:unnamed protein product [Lampetra planeri]
MDGRLVTAPRSPVPLPWIARLAAAGAAFATAYTNSPVCCPSRAALWSGLHTHVTAAWNNHKCLPPGYTTWLDRLRAEAGYTTAVFGKTDFTSGGHSLSNRVEAWTRGVPGLLLRQEPRPRAQLVGGERTRRVQLRDWNNTDRAVRWIRDVAPGRAPFALYLGLNLPHPYKTPSSGPNAGASTFRTSPYWLRRVRRGAVVVPRWLPPDETHPSDAYATFVKNCSGPFADDEIIAVRAAYYAMCAETDAMLGAVVRALGAAGFDLRGDTYVAFTCDHGELALEHRQYYKMSMYEGSARVPLVIAGPRVRPRKQHLLERTLVSLVDIYPTMMDIAGLPHRIHNATNYNLENDADENEHDDEATSSARRDLVKLSRGHRWALSQFHGSDLNESAYMLRVSRWKLVAYGEGPSSSSATRPQLFDLVADPEELRDLSASRPHLTSRLEAALRSLIDYPAVTRAARRYDRDAFLEWRAAAGPRYREAIAGLRWYRDWAEDPRGNLEAIDAWLERGE